MPESNEVSPTFAGKPIFPLIQSEVEALLRILERFVSDGTGHLKTNFQNHPEAATNPYLVTEYVSDMALAARIYSGLSPGRDVYSAAARRTQTTPQPILPPALPAMATRGPGDEVDLLTALEHNRGIIQRSATERVTERAMGGGLLSQTEDE
jgi:hypothetical protein